MNVVFAGGGTGGHIYPMIAVAEALKHTTIGTEILFISGTKDMERAIIQGAGHRLETLTVTKMPRRISPAWVPFAYRLGMSVVASLRMISRFKADVVVATGGYVSAPPVMAAKTLGVPSVIIEQNSWPGFTTRRLARFADMVCLGFADARRHLAGVETLVTGNPVRAGLGEMSRETGAAAFGLDAGRDTVLIFGGSQGARAINTAVGSVAGRLGAEGYQVLWQTGAVEYDTYKDLDNSEAGRIRVLPYIDDMGAAYAASDIAVCRAGAMTIAELTACGLPAIYIPLPGAAANHQEYNARSLVKEGAGDIIVEKDLTPDLLMERIQAILGSNTRRTSMHAAALSRGANTASPVIADLLVERYARR